MSLKSINKVMNALNTVSENVYHYHAYNQDDKYIVWAEDAAKNISGNNKMQDAIIQGTVDYFTKEEFDEKIIAIEEALNNAEIAFYLNSVQYEEETGYIHYEWVFEVV